MTVVFQVVNKEPILVYSIIDFLYFCNETLFIKLNIAIKVLYFRHFVVNLLNDYYPFCLDFIRPHYHPSGYLPNFDRISDLFLAHIVILNPCFLDFGLSHSRTCYQVLYLWSQHSYFLTFINSNYTVVS